MKLTFQFEKETKNTVRYKEVGDNPVVGTLYVQKSAIEGKPPAELTITVGGL